MSQKIKSISSADIKISILTTQLIKQADAIITATSSTTTFINSEELKTGAIVCDVSMPPNIARDITLKRRDLLIYEGGYARLPYPDKIKNATFSKHFPLGSIFGCFAETIILALENRFENYSIGRGNITEEKIEEIKGMGEKHGFSLSPFFCSNKLIDIDSITSLLRKRK